MEHVDLRLDFLKSEGIKLSVGDLMCNDGDEFSVGNKNNQLQNLSNKNIKCFDNYTITSFSPRKNTGVQPVDDDLYVVCCFQSIA